MIKYITSFLMGGSLATFIIYSEASGFPLLSRLAAIIPITTWIPYLFMGMECDPKQFESHVLFVLLGTLVAWVPYMCFLYFFTEKLGAMRAVMFGIMLFLAIATCFTLYYKSYMK